ADIGRQGPSTGTATLSGAGTSWTDSLDFSVGVRGQGGLTVQSGATVTAPTVTIGVLGGGIGDVDVDGFGSSLTSAGPLVVGSEGAGTLDVTNGAALLASSATLGDLGGSDGQVTMSGSAWNVTSLLVGNEGAATLTVQSGSTVATVDPMVPTIIGGGAASIASVIVNGGASQLTVGSTTFYVGELGDGTLEISGGGTASSGATFIADELASSGAVHVNGASSSWTVTGNLFVGNAGDGEVAVSGGGHATVEGLCRIGDNLDATGLVTVQDASSQLECQAETFVGNEGSGEIAVSGGATLLTSRVKVGDEIGAEGAVSVTGTGTAWSDAVEIIVGNFGTGSLDVSGGATVNGVLGTIGDDPGGNGTVTVSEAGSSWTSTGQLTVGVVGSGLLRVHDAGQVSTQGNYQQGANGALEVRLAPGSVVALDVANTAQLAGELTVSLADGFSPPVGSTFTLVAAGAVNGEFDTTTLPPDLELSYLADEVLVEVVGVAPIGACCLNDNSCVQLTQTDCELQGGGYQGDDTTCAENPCAVTGDINGDGMVDVDDLVLLILAWGPCPVPPAECPADINDSGMVDVDDLVLLILNWG
ncbi:MAG: hypothetical protein ACYTGC_12710, partial [Planctomycetota bacterium]